MQARCQAENSKRARGPGPKSPNQRLPGNGWSAGFSLFKEALDEPSERPHAILGLAFLPKECWYKEVNRWTQLIVGAVCGFIVGIIMGWFAYQLGGDRFEFLRRNDILVRIDKITGKAWVQGSSHGDEARWMDFNQWERSRSRYLKAK